MTRSLSAEAPTAVPAALPPVVPQVVAAATEALGPRLLKKLDATVERVGALPRTVADEGVRLDFGPDTVVTLAPGPSGVITDADQARCGCLLAPRCLHLVAVLTACPVADPVMVPAPHTTTGAGAPETGTGTPPDTEGPDTEGHRDNEGRDSNGRSSAGRGGAGGKGAKRTGDRTGSAVGADDPASSSGSAGRGARNSAPSAAARAAAEDLWRAAAAVLAAGVPGSGAVPQAELLRAAHSARVAGLHRAESAALRVVRGLRAARGRHDSHRLADLVQVLHELLLTAGRLAAGDPDPALVGISRRSYRPGGGLRVYGVCREPVISATGYGGVVTHLVDDEGRWFSIPDVQPGGPDRARSSATALVEVGSAGLTHARLARAGLVITGTTVSPDGRLGAGRGVRASPISGPSWSGGALDRLFARPLTATVGAQLDPAADTAGPAEQGGAGAELVGADLVLIGATGDHVLARELSALEAGPVIRLVPANAHPALAHLANLRRLASRPGLRIRVVARLDPDRASTLVPLAVGPVPGSEQTLRLPDDWQGHADLGYDLLQGAHLPPLASVLDVPVDRPGPDPVASAPLWRVRRLVELAVAGGRRAVGESARGDGPGLVTPLRRAGFQVAAELTTALAAESDRQGRDAFGRLTEPDPDRYAWAWVAAVTHLAATERALVRASWSDDA
ncbi:hypothetical protein GCM10022225_44790 [Plantactinospora mayteni]|uniref:SWIM-type domain-containing protein n=1 Tax=Plantactinospora mayteni TaxID=566021 RepID=A0ABQ4ERN5_9ACTN|nr:SWIM zinc finger family protein [Plantactinospora mayteni]GIG97311.1 hypothetical protein Pma05_38840 [Plantactinospora mayteni]